MNYPLISEYIEAIKMAEENFNELKYLRPVLDQDGLPLMENGDNSVVFKMENQREGKFYAVKCFTKEQEGRAEAYRLIADELKNVSSPYLTPIRFLDKELFVDSDQTAETEFPVLLMDWVEGKTLDKYLRENLDNQYELEMLAYRFSQLAQWLIPQPFAHGDLKPDNILVREDGTLVLVDYDGMYVPAMKGQKARELGSPDFRHPQRTENDFDEHIDDFPLVSILLSLKAISINPHLLEEHGASDRLLFSYQDYIIPANSKAIISLHKYICDYGLAKIYSLFLVAYSQNRLQASDIYMLDINVSSDVMYDYALKLLRSHHDEDAYNIWLHLSNKGNPRAQNSIASCYWYGHGIKQDKIAAIEWWKKSAQQKNAKAQYNLGFRYIHGYGVEKNIRDGIILLVESASQGNADAQYELGRCEWEGRGVVKNEISGGLDWFKKAAGQGHKKAQFVLAHCLENGIFVEKDEKEALKLYKESANQNYSPAQIRLGDIYKKGDLGVYPYRNEAIMWYRCAARQNNKFAINKLAICYKKGDGVEVDYKIAFSLFKKAANLGSEAAKNNLYRCYEQFGRELDVAKRHNIESQKRIANWYLTGYATNRRIDDAFIWYAKSKAQGDIEGKITNMETAFRFLVENQKNDDLEMLYIIAKCFEHGLGTNKDSHEANNYFRLAAQKGYIRALFKLKMITPLEREYITKAKEFEEWLQKKENLSGDGSKEHVLQLLDCLHLPLEYHLNIHVAYIPPESEWPGDSSYFYIGENAYKSDIWDYLKLSISPMAAWQAYLIEKSPTLMPLIWHDCYIQRIFIYSTDDIPCKIINTVTPYIDTIDVFINDIKETIKNKSIVPTIGIYGDIAVISCCYWNNWEGLIREYVKISFEEDKVKSITKIKSSVLYKFDCGVRY